MSPKDISRGLNPTNTGLGALCGNGHSLMGENGNVHLAGLSASHLELHPQLGYQLQLIPWRKSWQENTHVVFWGQFAFCALFV